jgi:hypothetical protein
MLERQHVAAEALASKARAVIAAHVGEDGLAMLLVGVSVLGILWLWTVPRCPRCGGRPIFHRETQLPIAEAVQEVQQCPLCGYDGTSAPSDKG